MVQVDQDALKHFAGKYIWWKTPDEAVVMPERVIAQVMNIGDCADVHALATLVGDDVVRAVLTHVEAGQFSERSWAYWHYRLGLASVDHVPAAPVRKLMSGMFKPCTSILPRAQQQLWPEFSTQRALEGHGLFRGWRPAYPDQRRQRHSGQRR